MRKKGFIVSYASLFICYVVLNVILFLTLPDNRFEAAPFWIAWSFAFPFCAITSAAVTYYCSLPKNCSIAKIPPIYSVQMAFSVAYLVLGLIFMIISPEYINIKLLWILEIIVSAAYIILMLFVWVSTSYLQSNIEHQKEKVFYIRSLKTDLDSCLGYIEDKQIASLISDLSDKIRYSDPMSHESLKTSELKLQALVAQIVDCVKSNLMAEIPALVKQASIELDLRNNKCKILK